MRKEFNLIDSQRGIFYSHSTIYINDHHQISLVKFIFFKKVF